MNRRLTKYDIYVLEIGYEDGNHVYVENVITYLTRAAAVKEGTKHLRVNKANYYIIYKDNVILSQRDIDNIKTIGTTDDGDLESFAQQTYNIIRYESKTRIQSNGHGVTVEYVG